MLINGLVMKVFLAIGFVCFSMLCFFSQSVSENQLLWKITGKKLKKPSYIFGTFHSNDPRVFRFSDSTYNALMNADALVIEADMASLFSRTDTRLSKPYLMYDASGNPYTTNSKATKTRYGNEDGRPQFLDLYLQLLAFNSGKKVFALESIEEQLHIFDLFKAQSKIPGASAVEAVSQEKIISAYIAGDITKIRDFLKYQLAKKKDAYQWIISDRNLVMVDGIDTLCKKNSLFIAIGAAHLSGPEGVINQLRERGYNVKQVKATFSKAPIASAISLSEQNYFEYSDSDARFSVVFGGKPLITESSYHKEVVYQELGQGNSYVIETSALTSGFDLKSYVNAVFNNPIKSAISKIELDNGIEAYEGLSVTFGAGLSWRRIFVYQNKLYNLSCFGGNKFMSSDRPKRFFDKIILF